MPDNKGITAGRVFSAFNTRLGWMALLSSPSGITSLTLPHATEKAAVEALSDGATARRADSGLFGETISSIRDYMNGKPVDFTCALDLSDGTFFQQRVWMSCKTIPYGQTRSYSWIAHEIGKPAAARAVGNALNKNPIPIIVPCHRVIAADGGIGGYGGGLAVKRELLALEGLSFER